MRHSLPQAVALACSVSISHHSERMSAGTFAAGNTWTLQQGARRPVRGPGWRKKGTDAPAEAASRKIDLGA